MTHRGSWLLALLAGALLLAPGPPATAQRGSRQGTPPLTIRSMSGKDLFEFYCASCHGRDGAGGGPVVAALKTAPPDLTVMARRNDGVLPKAHVEAILKGGARVPAHGSTEMPVWGPIFRALDPADRTANDVRIANIVAHVESLQTSR